MVDRRDSNKLAKAITPIMLSIILAWAGWVSLTLIDVKDRLARFETKMDILLSHSPEQIIPTNAKNP